jgi:hypothetical protein
LILNLLFLNLILKVLILYLKIENLFILNDDDDFLFYDDLTDLYGYNKKIFY